MFRPDPSGFLRRASGNIWPAFVKHPDLVQNIALLLIAASVTRIFDALLPFFVYFVCLHWMGFGLVTNGCWAGLTFLFRWGLRLGSLILAGVAFILNPLRPIWIDLRDGMIGTRIANAVILPVLGTMATATIFAADLLCTAVYCMVFLLAADRKRLADCSITFFTQGYPYILSAAFSFLALVFYSVIRRRRHSLIVRLDGTDAHVVPKQIACFVHFSIKACQLYPIGPEGLSVHIAEAVMLYFAAATEHYYMLSPSIAFSIYMSTTTALMIIDRCTVWGSSLAAPSVIWVLLTVVARLAILAFHERSRWDYIVDDVTRGSDTRLAWGMFAQLLTIPMGYYLRTTEWNWETLKEKAELIPEERFLEIPWQRFRVARKYYHGLPDSFFKSCSAIYGHNALVVIALAETTKALVLVGFATLIGSIVSYLERHESEPSDITRGHLFAVSTLLGSAYLVLSGLSSYCRTHSKFNARGGILGGIFDRLFGIHTFEQHLAEDMALVTTNLAAYLEVLDNRLSIPFQLFQLIVCCYTLCYHSGWATVLLAIFLGAVTHIILAFIRRHTHVVPYLEQRIAATTYAINDFLSQPDAFLMTGDLATMENMLVALEEKEVAAIARVNEFDVLRSTVGTIVCSPIVALALYGWYAIGNSESSPGTLGGMFECFTLLIIITSTTSTLYEHMATRERNLPALNEIRRFFHPTTEEAAAGPRINQDKYMTSRAFADTADIPSAIIDMARLDCLANPVGVGANGPNNDVASWKSSKLQSSAAELEFQARKDSSGQKIFTSNPDDKENDWIVIPFTKLPESRRVRSDSTKTKPQSAARQAKNEKRDKKRWLETTLRLKPQRRGKRRTRLAPAPVAIDDSSGDERPGPKFFDSYDGQYDQYVASKHTNFEDQHPVRFTAGEDLGIMFNFDFGKHFRHRRGILYRLTEADYKTKMQEQADAKHERRVQRRNKKKDRKDGRRIVREMRALRKSARQLERQQKQQAKARRLEKAKLAEQRKLETPEERQRRRAERRKRKMEEEKETENELRRSFTQAMPRRGHSTLSDYDVIKILGMAAPLPTVYQAPIMAYLTIIPDVPMPNSSSALQSSTILTEGQQSSSTDHAALEQPSSSSPAIESTPDAEQLQNKASEQSSNAEVVLESEESVCTDVDTSHDSNLPLNSEIIAEGISSASGLSMNGNGFNHVQSSQEGKIPERAIDQSDTDDTDQPRHKGKGPAPPVPPLQVSQPRYRSEPFRVSRPSFQGTGEGPSTERILPGSAYLNDGDNSNTYADNATKVSSSDSDYDSDGTVIPDTAETSSESIAESHEHRRVRFDTQGHAQNSAGIEAMASAEQNQIQKAHDLAVRLAEREVNDDEIYRDRQARDLEKRIAEACRQDQIERGAQLVERLRTQAVRRLSLSSHESLAPGRLEYVPVGIVPKTYIPVVEPNATVSWELADFAMIYQGVYRHSRPSGEAAEKSDSQEDSSRLVITATGHVIDPSLEDDQVRVEMDYKDILPCLPTARLSKRGMRAVVKEREYLYDGSVGARAHKRTLPSKKQQRKEPPQEKESKTVAEQRALYNPQLLSHALVLATADRMKVLKPLSRRARRGKKPRKDGAEYDEIDVMTSTIDTMKIRIRRPPKVDKYGGYGDPDWTDSSASTGSDSSVLSLTDESEDENNADGGNTDGKGGNGGPGNGGGNGGSGSGGDGSGGKKATAEEELAEDYILPSTTYCPPPPSTPTKKGGKKGTGKKGTPKKKAAASKSTTAGKTPATPVTPATPITPATPTPPVTPATPETPATPAPPVPQDSPVTVVTPVTPVTPETEPVATITTAAEETTVDTKTVTAKKSSSPKKKTGAKKTAGTKKATPVKRARFANSVSFRPEPGIHGPTRAPGGPILDFNHDDDGDYGDDGTNMYDKFKDIDELAKVPPANLKTTHSRLATYNHADDSDSERELQREFEYSDLLHRVKEKGDENAQRLIILRDALISHEKGGEPILKKVSMTIRAKSITSIGGMPGTGKTTLLRCMMRRAFVASGSLELATGLKVAYAGQNSWFRTVPYRENIIGPEGFDEAERTYEWYMKVMGACMLLDKPGYENEDDTKMIMHESDKPSLKEKQRVALARAIFSKPDVLLLDDPFSEQDEPVAQLLFDQLLAEGGLLRGKMAIVVTSSDSRPFTRIADNVYMIKKSFEHKPGPRRVARMKASIARRQSVKFWERAEWVADETRSLESPIAPILESVSGNMMRNHVLLNEAYSQGPLVSWTQVWKHGDPHRPFLCAALVLLAGCCDSLGPALIALLGNHPAVLRRVLVLGVLAKLMGTVLYCAATWMFFMTVVPRALKDVSTKLIAACTQSSRIADHGQDRKDLGGLLLVILQIVKTKLPAASFNTCVLASQFLCVATIAAMASPWLIPIFGICLYFAARFAKAASRVQSEFDPLRERHGSHPTRLHFAETLQSLEQMQRLDWYDANTQWTARMCVWSQKLFLFESGFHAWKDNVSRLWIMLTWLSVVAAGLFLNPSPHAFGIMLLMLLQTIWTFPLLVSSGIDYYHAMMSMGQLLHRIENVPLRNLDTEEEPPAWWPNSRRVDFDNVTVYTQNPDGKNTEMVRNFTFSMVYRHHHAFYDEPDNRGAALHRALCKIVPYEGVIKFGGLDIKKIPLRRLLQYVQAIPGVPTMLPGTIRQNLVPSELLTPPRDPQRLQAIIDQVLLHMGLQNIIRDTSFLMRDVPLTADQQLRFMAAKALVLFYLRQQPIVFEDNLASNCGKWSRRVVVRAFNELYRMQGRLILSDEPLPVSRIPLVGFISEFSGEVAMCKPHRHPEPFYLKGGPVYESD